jgi:hypothetical protein
MACMVTHPVQTRAARRAAVTVATTVVAAARQHLDLITAARRGRHGMFPQCCAAGECGRQSESPFIRLPPAAIDCLEAN